MTDSPPSTQPAFGETAERRPTPGFGAAGLLVGLLAVVVVVGGLVGLAVAGQATPASRVHLLGGSIVLPDNRPLTVVNRATGQPTAQLQGVNTEVGAASYSDVQAVPFDGGTLLVNRETGTFNLLEADNYVADRAGRGVGLGPLKGTTSAAGYAAGSNAYILRRGPSSTVSLVDAHTVIEAADNANAGGSGGGSASTAPTTVSPVGFANLHGTVSKAFGSVAVARGAFWTLVNAGGSCRLVVVAPSPGKNGTLPASVRDHSVDCNASALASDASGIVGLASSRQVTLYPPTDAAGTKGTRPAARPETVVVPALAHATRILPVTGDSSELWYLADGRTGWLVVGVDPATRTATAKPLHGMSAGELPAPPVMSDGQIYTLPRQAALPQQPPLWVINPTTGAVGTVKGESVYPKASRTEQDDFNTAGVVVSGPRVVFNNPGSLLAVMVFTDGSHRPVEIAKSAAPDIAPNGPAQVTSDRAAQTPGRHGRGRGHGPRSKVQPRTTPPTTATPRPKPAASPTVNCATTTEKPYAPTQLSVSPSSESATVSWHYNLLTDADCEPQTWTVTVRARGAPQPSRPVQSVNGQQQLDVTGLRPSTTYTAFVTAYIRHQSTKSAPVTFKTAAQAADPPTSVTAHVTPTGSWVVHWTACHRANCYTPAAKWVVTGTACGGSFAGTAPSAQVAGSQDSVTFDAASLGRLGQSLRFSVQGVSALGLPGNPVSESTCLQSWRPPQRSGITLAASGRVVGSSVDATLSVAPALSDADVYGSLQTDLQYMLNGHPVGGPTTRTTFVATGLSANTRYYASVAVWPAGHPASRVVVHAPTAVKDDLQWSPGLTARLHVTPNRDNPDVGTVTATFVGLGPGGYHTGGTLVCGSASNPLDWTTLSGDVATFSNLNLVQNGGTCTADLTIDSTRHPDPYGTPDSLRGLTLQMPSPPSYSFGASYTQSPCSYVNSHDVRCTDTVTVAPRAGQRLAGVNWQIVAYQGSRGGACSHTTNSGGVPGWPQTLTMAGCRPTSDGPQVTVQISWQYLGQTGQAYATAGGQSGSAPSTTTSTTSTSTSTSTTTSTTLPSSTSSRPPKSTTTSTRPPKSTTTSTACTSTTSASSTTSSTNPQTTTTTTTCSQGNSSGAAALTASRGQPGPPSDPGGSPALDVLVGAVVLGTGGAFLADRRRRAPSRQPRGAH